MRRSAPALILCLSVLAGASARADEIASADLQIQGVGLKVITVSVATGVDIPSIVQTEFGGKQNDEVPVIEGLLAVGDLSGPGIDSPIRLETAPGHKFQIPGLSREGVYFLSNIRLMKGSEFLQPATPSVTTITVTNLLQTSVRVKQLTPDELRARGISVDPRNYDVFEYTFSFLVNGQIVEIPFPVIVDPRTHEVRELPKETPYQLPPVNSLIPPRWQPPDVVGFDLSGGGDIPSPPSEDPAVKGSGGRISIPAAIVIPNSMAVLHQFFAVTLMVTNGAVAGSSVTLDSITAQIKPPADLRTVKSLPPVAFNQPVPIVDATTGVTFLVAQAKGEAEWTMEGLKPGTHTVEVEVHATYKSPGQADFPLKGTVRASVVVHDPRFNVTFSHPDTVREGIEYSTFSFITNMSGVTQNIRVTNGVQSCAENPGANVCRVEGTPESHDLSIPAGEMRSIEYKLRPGITGHVFATAGSVSDDAIQASVQLHMGVSESGIPLSPATLVMPYYSRFVSQPMVSANLQLLGLGYSLATAPLTPALAGHPHVIKSDVFQRATDIARAGQRVFLGEPMRDALSHMALDLLGNSLQLEEWDELRREEKSGRTGAASVASELAASLGTASLDDFVSHFASITAWRPPYLFALSSTSKLAVRSTTSNAKLDVASEAASGWVRQLPYAELDAFRDGELAMVGRYSGDYEITVNPTANGPLTLDVILPATADASVLRAHFDLTASVGHPLKVVVTRGADHLNLLDEVGGVAAVGTITPVSPEAIRILGARQDLNLDNSGHKVSVLWNRPVAVSGDLLQKFSAQVVLNKDGVQYTGPRPISAAALQDPARVANLTFDHALSQNASYSMTVAPLVDPLNNAAVNFLDPVVPVIDNDRPGGILFGHVLKGDNSPIANAEVTLQLEGNAGAPQYDNSRTSDGAFLFEYVPRDIDNKLPGTYKLQAITLEGKSTSVDGAVRLPGRVHFVNLVFLGRGSAQGFVRYDNGEKVAGAKVVVGSTMFDQFRSTVADANGYYTVDDLPVGPLTFSATDEDGNVTYAASEIKTPGQLLVQDLSIFRKPFPGTATIRGIVLRSDTNAPVFGAHVGVYTQGYGLVDGFTDGSGRFEFTKVPVGFVTVLAAEWTVSREATAFDFDLAANEVRDLTMTLNVKPSEPLAVVEGDVLREDPQHPGDTAFYQKVAGALVKIDSAQAVTADANGHYSYPTVPVSFSTRRIQAYDPITKKTAATTLPQLDPSRVNNVPIFIATASGYGTGTVRVRLLDAAGLPVNGYRVIVPGFPPLGPTILEASSNGIYQLKDVPVGAITTVWATGGGSAYGDQTATGSAKVEFNGHVAALNLRLPGQGIVRAKLVADIDVIGDVKIAYPAWDEADQALSTKEITKSTNENGLAGFATFSGVPALQNFTVSSAHPVYGYAAQSTRLGFDGDVQTVLLQLNKLSTVRGTVYAVDGRTPIPGAAVRIDDGRQNPGVYISRPDGTFEFFNEPAGVNVRVTADITQDGVYRTGIASGTTPSVGGPLAGLNVIMRTQGGVDGRIVYAGYKVFDPQNPANNVIDNTPNDLSDNAPVPLAQFFLRELDYPYRSFGVSGDPLTADALGRFTINNVFTGPLRATAFDPGNQDVRGTWTGTLSLEGERINALIGIGAEGFGPVIVRVLDPNAQNAPVENAEVTLVRGFSTFDLSTTDATGKVTFDQVPVGTYHVLAYSKALGKSGGSADFNVVTINGASVDVVLEFSGRVDGKFSDPEAQGHGIPGAPVTLTAQSFLTRASTDTGGGFVFLGVREGIFRLDAKDTESNRRATASHNLTKADPNPFIDLQLEPTETLYLSVYLPNDSGGNSNVLAPIVNVEVHQRGQDFFRALQGNAFVMPALFRNEVYSIWVKEIGGSAREIRMSSSFPNGNASNPLKLVLPAYGAAEVHVLQGGLPAANARVTVSGGSKTVTVYTDATGVGVASGIPLGPAYVQVVSVDGAFSGSANTTITSQSTPVPVTITLGAYAGISGLVDAETGGPSVGTRVIASFSNRVLEAITDSTGRYTFQGIPTSTFVSLVYIGPDDVTVGAHQNVTVGPGDASRIIEALKVRLDATPPLVVSIFPADGSAGVSPDASLRIVFSEPIQSGYINTNYLQLIPADSTTPVNVAFATAQNADGTFTVTMTPPAAPPGQAFPLKSNTLYRIIISSEVRDLTGNKMPTTRGASFITADYAEPKVIKVVPATSSALQPATTFEFRFNEPIDPAPWQTGGTGVFHFYKLSAPGPTGTILAEKPGHAFIDPGSAISLFFAPTDPIEAESFYRIVFNGVRDMQGNATAQQTFHFFSYDLVKPFVNLVSPVPADFPLISGVEYTLGVDIRNADANGPPATDVTKVDYFRVDGSSQTYLFTATTVPWPYRFVAPDAPPAGSLLTLRAVATDLSGNESVPATMTWQVKPNQAPQNVTVAMTPALSVYPGNHALASVTFEDEGTFATVQVEAVGTKSDGSEYRTSKALNSTRTRVNDPWSTTNFDFDLPATLKQGTRINFNATVTDVRGLKGTATAGLDLSTDTISPEITSSSPAPQTQYHIGDKFTIIAVVRDFETGASDVTFAFDNQSITVVRPSSGVTSTGDHVWTFSSGQITVPAKNVDTTIPITITARDYNGNFSTKTTEVVYIGVNDPSVPKGAWLCPIDKAAYPAGVTIPVKLQVRATDDISVTGVKFTVPGIANAVTATRVGTSDVYEATPSIAFPADGQTLTLSATISDADSTHDLSIPIVLDAVAVDITIDNFPQAITTANASTFANKSIYVRGSGGSLVPHVPVTLTNLIVLDGARVETLSTTTTTEQKLDLTVGGHLWVDCASSIDVTARGYVGGWALNGDGSNTRNNDNRGRTSGNTNTGGPTPGASASHGGLGGQTGTGVTNATYDSFDNPTTLGTGGAGTTSCCGVGGSGGGAIKLQGNVCAVAGGIRADGGTGVGVAEAGSGGSIDITCTQFVAGPSARVTANGGDDDAAGNASRGGGGGRVAIDATQRFDIETFGVQLQARGGRNNTGSEGSNFLDGGAGTIFVRRPGQTLGDLFAGSFDERAPLSTHFTRPTPLAGTLQFDHLNLGSRALVRADASLTIGGVMDSKAAATIDPTAVLILNGEVPVITASTTPAPGGSLIQASSLSINYSATSAAGIGSITLAFSPVTPDRVDAYNFYPAAASPSPLVSLGVPFDAAVAPATLTLSTVDRAGRTGQLAPLSYSIVANAPPIVDLFDPAPLSLYPGKSVTTTVSAHDDLKITKLTFTSTIGTGAPAPQTIFPNVPAVTNQVFSVTVPITTLGGQDLKLDLSVEDAFPNRAPATQTKIVSILKDTVAPVVTIIAPTTDQLFNEGTGNTIQVRATINDAEVGVNQAFVQIDGGTQVTLTKSGSEYIATLPVPSVEGTVIVNKSITVTGKDYEGNASSPSVNIKIQPLNDPNAPSINWMCSTNGAMYPAGYASKLRVFALGNTTGNPANGIQKVEMFVDDSTTPLTATPVPGVPNNYEVIYAIPAGAAAGTVTNVRAVATNASGLTESASTSFTVVAGTKITADKTITAADTSFDGQTVIVQGGTTTIIGQHTFDKLIVLDGAKVTQQATDATTVQRLTFTATSNVFVSCLGSIDVSQRGITGSTSGTAFTYDRATDKPTLTGGATNFSAGSHGGQGGLSSGNVPAAFGSPFDPNTPGGAGANSASSTCSPCRSGGGVVRFRTGGLVLDGKVLANGEGANASAAGGSIRIEATSITGAGEIHADGGLNTSGASGGGGRVAVLYSSLAIPTTRISAASLQSNTPPSNGAPGTIYLRQNDASGAKIFDELLVDNLGRTTSVSTVIVTAGAGTVSAVNGNVVTLSAPVPFDIEGTWIEFLGASGNVVSSYEITARSATTVTVRLGTGESSPAVAPGNGYRGMVRVNRMTSQGLATFESSGATASTFVGAAASLFRFTNVNAVADATLQTATMEVNGVFTAPNLTLTASTLTHSRTTATTINRLNVNVAGTLTLDATSAIDVSARGITGSTNGTAFTYDRATDKPTLTGGATNFSAGSHGGQGGLSSGNVPAAYGSLFDPNEPGSAGANSTSTTCSPCRSGGGVARVKAGTLQLDGKILANGEAVNASGAGGSIRVDAATIAGAGEIHADGGVNTSGASGGGGRIALYYNSLGIPAAKITAASLQSNTPASVGAPGTIYFRQNDSNGAKIFDEVVADNLSRVTTVPTVIVTAGSGTVTAVNGNVVTLSAPVPFDIEGTWIQFLDATGGVISSYEIIARTSTTVTLRLAEGEAAANVTAGAAYRGMLNVNRVTSRGAAALQGSGVMAGSFTTATSGLVRFTDLHSTGDVTMQGATVEVNGSIKAANLNLLQSSTLTQGVATATSFNRLNITLTGSLTIDATSQIDVSARGLTGSVNGTAYTYDRANGKPSLTGGAFNFSAGSHGGLGGVSSGNVPSTFGSLFDPNEPGSAGASSTSTNCMPCRSGGGVVRIKAAAVQIDGKILANGESANASGAGGSVRIDAATVAGIGEIHADGGTNTSGASGGGGRIAIYYGTLSIPPAKITAASLQSNTPASNGAPGTIYLKSSTSTYGDLIVDNLSRTTTQSTTLAAVGYATVTDFGADFVKDANAQFLAPDQLRGVRVVVNYDRSRHWPIVTNDPQTLRLDVSGQPLAAATGQPMRGLYRLDSIKLRNAKLNSIDLIESTAAVDKDAASSIAGNNQAPPVLDSTKITLQLVPTGSAVLGTAGAVTDLDTPITVIAKNTRTGNEYPASVTTQGTFVVAVAGTAGDVITLKARDANLYPLESPVITVGALQGSTPVPSQVNKSDWTNDPNFLPRILSKDGAYVAVASMPTNNGASDKLVVLGVADPAHPNLLRTVPSGVGAIRDVVVQNGVAYVAADRFFTLDLTNSSSVPVYAPDAAGSDYCLALAGGYAFTAEVNSSNTGRINVYDVSNPAAPHYIRTVQTVPFGGFAYTDIQALGTDYLVGISNWRPSNVGHDISIIDRRDLAGMAKVAELEIQNFEAFRGTIVGTNLYVISANNAQVAVVDLSDPLVPKLLGTAALPAAAGGVSVVGRDAFVAALNAGLVTVNVTDPAAPFVTGVTTVGGTAWDVSLVGAYAYVANELGVVLVPAQIAPQIADSRISLNLLGTTVRIEGQPQAVTGNMPIVVDLRNATSGASVSGITVAADGSFSATLPAAPADSITITATDAFGLVTGPMSLGKVPFGSAVHSVIVSEAQSDAAFLVRNIATEGNWLAVSSYPTDNGSSDKVVVYDITDRANPVYKRTVSGVGVIREIAIENGWLILAGDRLGTLDLSDPASTPVLPADAAGADYSMVVVDGFAFTGEVNSSNTGRINIYDISTPSAPRYLRTQQLVPFGGFAFTGLAALGNGYLVGVSTWRPSNVDHDVYIIDRRDVGALATVAEVRIPDFDAYQVTTIGNTAYVAGIGGGLAVIDVTVPTAPVLKGIVNTPGRPFGVAAIGALLGVADGSAGATFLDAATTPLPAILGNQATGGNAWDAVFTGATLYVAAENRIAIIDNLGTPPLVDRDLIRIENTTGGTIARVVGAPKAILGVPPITFEIRNTITGASISGVHVNGDGSFTASIPASAGHALTVKATDTAGRSSGPFTIGTVPFGASNSSVVITPAMTDASFFARNVATAGNWLAVASYPTDVGSSDKIVLYDVTDRSNPVYKRTISTAAGPVRAISIFNGWLVFAADRLGTLDLSNPTSTPVYPADAAGADYSLVVVDGFAITGEVNSSNTGRLNIYDVSTPATPRYLRTQQVMSFGGFAFTGLASLGSDYLVAVSTWRPSNTDRDLTIIDRRDMNNLIKIAELPIPNFDAFRVKTVGTRAYIAGVSGGVAVVELANPAAPVLLGIVHTPGYPRGLDVLGATVAVGDSSAGATFLDASPADMPVILGSEPTNGDAWDCAFNGATLYVANESGIAVIDSLGTAPLIDRNLITMSSSGAINATITGAARSIVGLASLTVQISDLTTSSGVSAIPVAADGSFSVTMAAASGDRLTIKATDSAGRSTGPISIGSVPFGSGTTFTTITPAMSDANFFSRLVAVDGDDLVVTSYPTDNGGSDKLLLFDVSNPGFPVFKRAITVAAGAIRGVALKDGYAFVAADRLWTIDLKTSNATANLAPDAAGVDYALAMAGGYIFTAEKDSSNTGRINVYEASTPTAPRFLAQTQMMPFGGFAFNDLVPFGTDYLIGISFWRPSNTDRDVEVIDRRDPNNLRVVGELPLANFDAWSAVAVGNMLYVTGVTGGLAAVDMTNPAAPVEVARIATLGAARGIAASGPMLAIANGSNGVSFVDITQPANPRLVGSHSLFGTSFGVALSRGAMYAASEVGLNAVANVAMPPMLNQRLVTTTPSAAATTVSGAAQSLTGIKPITVQVKNGATNVTSSPVTVNADGSWNSTVAATAGQPLTILATDAGGRTTARTSRTFGTTSSYLTSPTVGNDVNFRGRHVSSDGAYTVISTGSIFAAGSSGSRSSNMLLFRPGDASPQIISSGVGGVHDAKINGGYLFVAGERLATINLADPTFTPNLAPDQGGGDAALALSDGFAFTAETDSSNTGRINIYNVTSPAAPTFVRQQQMVGFGGFIYRSLVPFGSQYLVALSPDRPSNVDHDIHIIDRTNINNMVLIKELQIANFDALDGVVSGSTLYVAGGDGGVAIVDLTFPTVPVVKAVINTPGIARSIAVTGPNEIVVADAGGPGITVIDVTDKANPVIVGSQEFTGNAVDVDVVLKNIYVAADNYFYTVVRP